MIIRVYRSWPSGLCAGPTRTHLLRHRDTGPEARDGRRAAPDRDSITRLTRRKLGPQSRPAELPAGLGFSPATGSVESDEKLWLTRSPLTRWSGA